MHANSETDEKQAREPRAADHAEPNGPVEGDARLCNGVGTLIIIGGREDRSGERRILTEVASRVGDGLLVVTTLASTVADELWQEYQRTFNELGVRRVEHLDIKERAEAEGSAQLELLKQASTVFFTGGSQLRITGNLGGTQLCDWLQEFYRNRGGTIAGTSAGASVMSSTMLVSGDSDDSHRIGDTLQMAPGLGFIDNVIIDQHFAQRGRIGRLLGAVAQNPRHLGIGIDENTSIIIEQRTGFRVLGEGAVYVLDGRELTHTNIAEDTTQQIVSIFGMRLHVLSDGDRFHLKTREPFCRRD